MYSHGNEPGGPVTASQLRARYWRIVIFFAGVTAGFIFWDIVLPRIGLGGSASRTRAGRYKRIAVRFRALAIRMGGLMIKVGQFLSVRLDVLPREITDELAGLQDEVPAEEFDAIREKATAELGEALGQKYAWIDETPMAAASFGQVHRARLHDDEAVARGFSEVVIKVQRPYIDQVVDVDLSAIRRVAGWLQRYRPVSDRADVRALVNEFASTTLEELDYLAEGRNAEIFSANFAENPRVHFPRVVWSLSTRHVLTLEDVSAIKIGDYEAIAAAGIDRGEVASLLVDVYRQQILEDGFFHADPHPGNLFVTPLEGTGEDGKRNWKLTLIDFGMVGRVPENLRAGLREAVIAVGTQDSVRLVQTYRNLGIILPGADLKQIETAGAQLFDRFWGMSMGELSQIDYGEIARFGSQFRELLLDMPFQLPQNLSML
jgi:predicted unusual protein kinase regulating ubiquinone biosynthesis (AarF/ABC1/UbiB family)